MNDMSGVSQDESIVLGPFAGFSEGMKVRVKRS